MAFITIYPQNILEDGTLTVTGTADTGYPEARLYDRATSLLWKDTVTEAKDFVVDYATAVSCDFLAIANHNFAGEDLQFQYSTDNFSGDINDAVTDWTQSGNGLITKEMSSAQSKRYWRVTLSSMSDPQCGEIFIGLGYEFSVLASPSPQIRDVANVSWITTIGGVERSVKWGESRKSASYSMFLDSTDLASFETAMGYLDHYSKPFYIKDHTGSYWFCRLLSEPAKAYDHKSSTHVSIEVIEML